MRTNEQLNDVLKFPRGATVRYYPRAGYHGIGKEEGKKFLKGRVHGHTKHTRNYEGPQTILVYFKDQNKSLRVKAYKLERIGIKA